MRARNSSPFISARAETPTRFPTKSLQSAQLHSSTSLDDHIRMGPTNRGRAYTRGGRGGRVGNPYHKSQNSGQQQHNIHDTRSLSRTSKPKPVPPLSCDSSQMDVTHENLSPEPNSTTAKTMPLQPRSADPVARRLHTAEDRLKVQIHDDRRNGKRKSSEDDILRNERENNGTPLPTDY